MAANWPQIGKKKMTSKFSDMTSSLNFFHLVVFLLSSSVTGPSFMSMPWLVLELWQFSFIKDWPEIRNLEIHSSRFCLISGDWGKSGIPNLAQMSLINCYSTLQNARVKAFTFSELLRENQQVAKIAPPPPPPRLGLKSFVSFKFTVSWQIIIFDFMPISFNIFVKIYKTTKCST